MTAIGWCAAGRLGELQAFIDAHWKPGHVLARDAELLRWQHPGAEPDTLSVLVADAPGGELIGMLGIIPIGFCAHGERVDGGWLTTWVVRERERGTHAGLHLLRAAMGELGFVGTLGGNAVTMRILGAMRFTLQDAVPRWVRPVSLPALESLLAAAGAARGDREAWERAAAVAAPGEAEAHEFDTAAWELRWSALAPSLAGTWRDAGYIAWRYLQHPRFDYRVRTADDGLLVYRRQQVQDRPEAVVRIVELLGSPEAATALTAALLEEIAADEAVAFAEFWCTSPRFAAPLEASGFAPDSRAGADFPALWQPLDARRTRLTSALWEAAGATDLAGADVYFTRSDCDQDRPN